MSQLVQALFPVPDYRRTPLSLLQWWESRRLLYNLIVGAAGLATLTAAELMCSLPPAPPGRPPLAGVLVYGLAANVCYTLGWLVETALEKAWKRDAPLIGPALFRQGLAFSVGLTLLPIPLLVIGWLARVGHAIGLY